MKKENKIIIILLVIIAVIVIGFLVWKNMGNKENTTTNNTTNVSNIANTDNTTNNNTTSITNNNITNTTNTANNNTTNTTSTTNSADTKQLLLDVMNSKQKFIGEDNKEVFFKDFKIVENQTAKVDKYTFVDLDKDGIEELIILTTSDYGAYVILHYETNKVYGYMLGFRSLEELKTDGSFMGSNGAASSVYLRMSFNKNSYNLKEEAVYDETNKVYKINNTNVSEKEIKEYVENWNKKENANWSK